jgi:hypothetical protein
MFPYRLVEEDRWFADYWGFLNVGMGRLEAWIGPVLIFMLEAQVLTVLLATLTIFRRRVHLLLSAAVLNVLTISCMFFITLALSDSYAKMLQAGFWLTLPSAALFFTALFLSWKQLKQEIQNSSSLSSTLLRLFPMDSSSLLNLNHIKRSLTRRLSPFK